MMVSVDPRQLPAAAGNRLYLDYISDWDAVAPFYTHPPHAFAQAGADRSAYAYPRQDVSRHLAEYNRRLGAQSSALGHVEALGQPGTLCVITGQQAGFLGGPVYTAYKIITTIRLSEHLTHMLGVPVVPVFWLASEDHDLQEINHAYVVKRDGEIGRARFRWREQGRPIADLPVTGEVRRAYDAYWSQIVPSQFTDQVREVFAYRAEESFCEWQARVWSSLFAAHGLVVVEPHVIRAAAPEFFRFALAHTQEIRHRLDGVAQRLTAAGYVPALTSEQAGLLYTRNAEGQRVRVQEPGAHVADAALCPERYSTDAALRPLLADAVLPVVASVLGPGETAYQAMLKPLYELFDIPQPVLYPRQSYTIVARREADRLALYNADPRKVLTEQLSLDVVLSNLVPAQERALMDAARRGIEQALAPLRSYAESIEPGLARTWDQTVAHSMRSLAKLEQRAVRARMRQLGFSKGELRRLQNALLPRDRPQERILPLVHFMNRHGPGFIDAVFGAGELGDYRHHVVIVEDGGA